ncbi:MAG TPA: excinuclease ABC subunit UvrC, partial [Kiritimatiellae bacterium]|nr:excinuclease ABC subunit UvrC [Kiritimatiellia bacterium]
MRLSSRIQDKLQQLPDRPGVYIMRDGAGRVIYVGKASSLRKRVRWYFRQATLRSADPKLRGLVKSVYDLSFIICRTEAEAALTEARLIKDFRPRYNVQFRDDKRFLMLKVNLSEPFPRFSTCRVRKDDSARYFGPYPSSRVARTALDFVEKRYGLRRCRALIPDHEDWKHCLNDTVRYCSAPCVGKISRDAYLSRVAAACRFLQGEKAEDLEDLRGAMMRAAEEQDYEKAAALRDLWLRLREALRDRRCHVRRLRYSREEALQGIEELQRVLGLKKLPVVIETFDISHISGSLAVGSMVRSEYGIPRPGRYRRYRIRISPGRDDTAMLREVIGRRYRRLLNEGKPLPDLVLVDGGAPQVAAAKRVLDELGQQGTPVAGLAKRLE